MKIDSPYKSSAPPVSSRTAVPRENTPTSSTEDVSLSTLASTLQSGEKPPVDSAKVLEIKDAIAQGRFKINPEAIADGLIETARDLINSQHKA